MRQLFSKPIGFVFTILIVMALFFALRYKTLMLDDVPGKYVMLLFFFVLLIVILLANPRTQGRLLKIVSGLLKTARKYHKVLAIILFVVTILFQIVMALNLSSDIGWDPIQIYRGIFDKTEALDIYMSTYPNNAFYFLIMWCVSKVFQPLIAAQAWSYWNLFNALAIDVGIVLIALAAKKKFGKKAAYVTFLLGVLVMGLSPWVLIPYTDTISWLFTGAALFVLASVRRDQTIAKQVLQGAVLGLLAMMSYQLKPSLLILFVAFGLLAVVFLLQNRSKLILKAALPHIAAFVLVALVAHAGWGAFLEKQTFFRIDHELTVTPSHYISMGMGTNETLQGAFNPEDAGNSLSIPTYKERDAYNKARILEKLKDFGPAGYTKFLLQKYEDNTADGSFFWGGEGGFLYGQAFPDDHAVVAFLKQLYYPGASAVGLYQFNAQIIWLFLLLMLLFSRKEKSVFANALRLAVIGGLVFLLIFESGRSRYLMQFLPMMLILGSLGIANAGRSVEKYLTRLG